MSARKIRRAAAHAARKAERKSGFVPVSHSAGTSNGAARGAERKPISLARHNGFFTVLPTEDQDGFEALRESLAAEYCPTTVTEAILINTMAESQWLAIRAQRLAQTAADLDTGIVTDEKSFAFYLRYETTQRRAFHKALNDLLKLRAARRKDPVGFEAQNAEPPAQEPVDREFEADRTHLEHVACTSDAAEYQRVKAEIFAKHGIHQEEEAAA